MNSENIQVSGVAKTMFQSMYARVVYSQKPGHKFYDGKAIKIAQAMNYDFSKADKDALMSSGVLARTILLDEMVKQFIEENPNGTLGEGCESGGGDEGIVSHLSSDWKNPCLAELVK